MTTYSGMVRKPDHPFEDRWRSYGKEEFHFSSLIGRRIVKMQTNDRKDLLAFYVTNPVDRFESLNIQVEVYATENDCCNEVWFNHISGVDIAGGAVVKDVIEKTWTPVDPTRQEVEEAILWTLKTDKGYIDIEVRNSHNGYYGGDVCKVEQPSHYDHQEMFTDVTEDF